MKKQQQKLKVLTKANNVYIVFGEWFDRTYGNTYYDALVTIDNKKFYIPYQYGYNATDKQSIDEALESAGYRVRNNKNNIHEVYKNINTYKHDKLKRDLFK